MAQNRKAIIQAALLALDINDDNLWTSDGSPRIDALSEIPGLKRPEIIEAAPQFSRTNPVIETKDLSEDKGNSYLLGSSVQPAIFTLEDKTELQLGDIVQEAFENSELTIEEWNKLEESEREKLIQTEVDKLELLKEEETEELEEEETEPKEPSLLELKKAAEEELAKATKAKEEAAKIEKIAIEKLDGIIRQLEKTQSDKTTQMDIMDYIASQNKLRMQRAIRHQEFIAKGVDLSRMGPAPIDAAMRKGNSRGTKRPARGLMVSNEK